MDDKPVYSGYLLLPPVGKIILKKTWQQKYCILYNSSKFGIGRLEIFESTDFLKITPQRIITLNNCIKINQKGPSIFCVVTKTGSYEFDALSTTFLNEWLSALQSVAFPDDSSRKAIEEDNDLYCSSGENVFYVKLHSSEASTRCGLEPKMYTLVLTSASMQLRSTYEDGSSGKVLYSWPYCFIRKYGYRDGKFTFEAGRMCDSGEGTFFLEHSNQKEIYRCLASKIQSVKKLLKGESTPPILDNDNQFQAALSMEARSRSPLPPSPATSTSGLDLSTSLSTSQGTLLDSTHDLLGRSLPHRPKPLKPPRRVLMLSEKSKSIPSDVGKSDYEPIDKYDEVEYRSEAWKTLGIDEVVHSETVMEPVPPTHSKKEVVCTKSTTIIKNDFPLDSHAPEYDSLDFFPPNKSSSNKSGYKQISTVTIASGASAGPSTSSTNDYDEVQPAMESVRLADDSHLGYALIRKEPKVDHQFHNEEPYAVISKPKRV